MLSVEQNPIQKPLEQRWGKGKEILQLFAASWRGGVVGAVGATFIYLFISLLPQHLGRGLPLLDGLLAILITSVLMFLGGALADLIWLIVRLTTRFFGWVLTKFHLPERGARLPYRAVKVVPIWFVRGTGAVLIIFGVMYFLIGQTG